MKTPFDFIDIYHGADKRLSIRVLIARRPREKGREFKPAAEFIEAMVKIQYAVLKAHTFPFSQWSLQWGPFNMAWGGGLLFKGMNSIRLTKVGDLVLEDSNVSTIVQVARYVLSLETDTYDISPIFHAVGLVTSLESPYSWDGGVDPKVQTMIKTRKRQIEKDKSKD